MELEEKILLLLAKTNSELNYYMLLKKNMKWSLSASKRHPSVMAGEFALPSNKLIEMLGLKGKNTEQKINNHLSRLCRKNYIGYFETTKPIYYKKNTEQLKLGKRKKSIKKIRNTGGRPYRLYFLKKKGREKAKLLVKEAKEIID